MIVSVNDGWVMKALLFVPHGEPSGALMGLGRGLGLDLGRLDAVC